MCRTESLLETINLPFMKAMITCKRPTKFGQQLTRCFKIRKRPQQICQGLVNTVHFLGVWIANYTKCTVPNVAYILAKDKTYPLKQTKTCANYGFYVATFVICNKQDGGKTVSKFSRDGQRIEILGANQMIGMAVS